MVSRAGYHGGDAISVKTFLPLSVNVTKNVQKTMWTALSGGLMTDTLAEIKLKISELSTNKEIN